MTRRSGKARLLRGGIAVTVLTCSLVGIGAAANAKPICDGDNPPPVCTRDPVDPPPSTPAPLHAPTGLGAYDDEGFADLHWVDPNTSEDGYIIEWVGHGQQWRTGPGGGSQAARIAPLPFDTDYCVDVWAFRGTSVSSKARYCGHTMPDYPDIW